MLAKALYCVGAAQFALVSALVYAGHAPPILLAISFGSPLVVAAGFGFQSTERTAFVLAFSSLAGLPDSSGTFFGVFDPSVSLGPVGSFTIVAAVLGVARLFRGRYELRYFIYVTIIPLVGFSISLLLSDGLTLLVASEFAKFLVFLVFLLYALTARRDELWAREIMAPLAVSVLLAGLIAFVTLDAWYLYGGARYMYVPASMLLVPLLCWQWTDRRLLIALLVLTTLAGIGFVQASGRLVVIILIGVAGYVARRQGFLPAALAGLAVVLLGFVLFPFLPDGMRFKMASVALLVSGAYVSLGDAFYYTSAGNMLAELRAVLSFVGEQWLLPLGPGFAVPDKFGELALANSFAYPQEAFNSGNFFPLHLGAFYLILWYGAFVALFFRRMGLAVFLLAFVLTGATYKPLLFAAAFLSGRARTVLDPVLPHASTEGTSDKSRSNSC